MFLDGNRAALRAYLSGDRQDPKVRGYFERLGIAHVLPPKTEGAAR
jgi:hypothetical protein